MSKLKKFLIWVLIVIAITFLIYYFNEKSIDFSKPGLIDLGYTALVVGLVTIAVFFMFKIPIVFRSLLLKLIVKKYNLKHEKGNIALFHEYPYNQKINRIPYSRRFPAVSLLERSGNPALRCYRESSINNKVGILKHWLQNVNEL